jgi:adenylate cyclase
LPSWPPRSSGAAHRRSIPRKKVVFTTFSESRRPEEVVDYLNSLFSFMIESVNKHDGIVNKFLGDGFMALFGGSIGRADHADAALAAGQEMLRRLQDLNQRLAVERHPPLEIGIGMHTGPAIIGSIGSPQRQEYTAIGETVNVAARVEGLTKNLAAPLLLTAATRAALRASIPLDDLPPQCIKGYAAPLEICRPSDTEPSQEPAIETMPDGATGAVAQRFAQK